MGDSRWALSVLSGEDHGAAAALLRGVLSLAEPMYAQAMDVRNFAYRHRLLKSHRLPRPTISVGNITTGGTGKTPVVLWIAQELTARNLRPAILLRGYRGNETGGSDEERVLADAIGAQGVVIANADRIAAAMTAMSGTNQPDVFILDDGFQHRRVRRDFDLVLIDATEPFGFRHVLPRGLLRERVRGLRRASAVIVTRCDQVSPTEIQSIQARLRAWVPASGIFFATHAHAGLRASASPPQPADLSVTELARRPFFAFAGIANPQSLRQQLDGLGRCVGFREFRDHRAYSAQDLGDLEREARSAGAEVLVTTEKDWVKIRPLPRAANSLAIWRLDLQVRFSENDGERLMTQIMSAITRRRAGELPAVTVAPRA